MSRTEDYTQCCQNGALNEQLPSILTVLMTGKSKGKRSAFSISDHVIDSRRRYNLIKLVQPQSMFDFVRVYISLESFPTFATTLSTMRLASLARRSFLKSGIQFNGKINLATRVDSRMHHQFTGSSQGGACTAALLSVPRSPTTSEVFPPGDSKSAHTLALSGTELAVRSNYLCVLLIG